VCPEQRLGRRQRARRQRTGPHTSRATDVKHDVASHSAFNNFVLLGDPLIALITRRLSVVYPSVHPALLRLMPAGTLNLQRIVSKATAM